MSHVSNRYNWDDFMTTKTNQNFLVVSASNSGTPSFARLFRYPDFNTAIASKSFFQADRVEMKWNKKGTAVLLITMTDVDKTGKSYYGKTILHYLDTKGHLSFIL